MHLPPAVLLKQTWKGGRCFHSRNFFEEFKRQLQPSKIPTLVLSPLRGRYLWLVQYIERLKQKALEKWTPEEIRIEAEKTAKRAEIHLEKRLTRLQEEKQFSLLDQLCWVAIQSDLLDKPTIFEKDEDCKMISLAFAVVKPIDESRHQYGSQLREQLALEAVIEFFRQNQRSQYDKKLRDFLYSQQNDAGALRKVAEWFLAWVSLCVVRKARTIAG